MSPGIFGKAFLDSLQQNRPEEYRNLKDAGQLESSAAAVDARANEQYQALLKQLSDQDPDLAKLPYPQKVQRMQGLAEQARELVLDEVLVRAPEDEE